MQGIDVSRYQLGIDFKKVKEAGYKFCITKATQGTNWIDPYYYQNQRNARVVGILFGSYHFADGGDATKEADHFIKAVGAMQEGELLVLDWEINYSNPADWCKKFLDRCFEKTGVRPLLYTNEARVKSINWNNVVSGNYGLWIARYYLNTGYKSPLVSPSSGQWPFWAIWQFTSRGKVPGIAGNVDLNYTKMDLATLKKYGNNQNEEPVSIYPFKDWKTAKRGYTFGQRTWYGTKHLGLDIIVPKGTPVYAWRDVEITFSQYGYQGGYQCWVIDRKKLIRFLHLQKLPFRGKYKRGQVIAYTGNTGALTMGSHVHLDCSKNGKLELYNFSNFQDPEEYFA